MCRHLAYLGPPATVHVGALPTRRTGWLRQSWAPRASRSTGRSTPTGSGWAGTPTATRCPARYRRAVPIWGDASFADLARVTRTRALLAAVRSATDGTAQRRGRRRPVRRGAVAVQPQRHARRLARRDRPGWPPPCPLRICSPWRRALTPRWPGRWCWHRLRAGESPADALAGTVGDLDAAGITGRFNFLLTDGRRSPPPPPGDTLCYRCRQARAQVVVASEPYDDEPGWSTVPDRTVLTARPGVVDASLLKPAEPASTGVRPRCARTPVTCTPSRRRNWPRRTREGTPPDDPAARREATCRTATWTDALRADARAGLTAVAEDPARPSGSTTSGAASCSRRSPCCPSTTRPGPSGRSWPPWPPRSPRRPAPARWSSWAPAPRRRPGCCSTRCATRARCAATCRWTSARAR